MSPEAKSLHGDIYIIKKSTEVTKYDDGEYFKDKHLPKKKNVFAGTAIRLMVVIDNDAYINIINEEPLISESCIWMCEFKYLLHVKKNLFPFIQAIPCQKKKIELLESSNIDFYCSLKTEDYVNYIEKKKKNYKAIIRYIGEIPDKGPGIFFGLELLNTDKGCTDGLYKKKRYFKCPKDTGVIVTIDQMTPINKEKMSKSSYTTNSSNSRFYSYDNDWNYGQTGMEDNIRRTEKNQISNENKGKTSQYFANDSSTQVNEIDLKRDFGFVAHNKNSTLVDAPKSKYDNVSPCISPVLEIEEKYTNEAYSDENSYSGHYLITDNGSNESENGYELTRDERIVVGSPVEICHNSQPHFGVIKWIGMIDNELKAGIEMDKEDPDFTNGSINDKSYFKCEPNTGYFININKCRLDSRLNENIAYESRHNEDSNRESPVVNGVVPPISIDGEVPPPISGKYKGIQGHHNSCYLDATLFSMFTFTSVFDSLLYRPPNPSDIDDYAEVQSVLRDEIVNPLRKNSFVSADRVMKLRRLMEKLSSVSGLTTEEKDPEEFLTSLVAQILKADPFLKLSSGQEAFHYQLFVEKNEKLVLPTVQQLFEQSFYSSDIKLKEVPACLIIQMPRFGKSYKMYPRILPSQLLDVTDVIENSPRHCFVCGKLAKFECRNCFDGLNASIPEQNLENTAYCSNCVERSHGHQKRANHNWRIINSPAHIDPDQFTPRLFMELFAVVCIETSHYVTFVKCGEGSEAPWCFFDSMADRKGEQDGFNIPEVVMCQGLPHWLSEKGALNFQQYKDSELPEHAKRLLCDAYMCMYQSQEVMMYR